MIWWSRRSDRLKERKKHTILPTCLPLPDGYSLLRLITASSTERHHYGLNGIIYRNGYLLTTPDQVISLQSRAVAMAVIMLSVM